MNTLDEKMVEDIVMLIKATTNADINDGVKHFIRSALLQARKDERKLVGKKIVEAFDNNLNGYDIHGTHWIKVSEANDIISSLTDSK